MAEIIYKKGMDGQNNLSSIEGIEIDLLNGQKALIYPKYTERQMLTSEQMSKHNAAPETEIEALRVTNTTEKTRELLKIGSPAAEWVSKFRSDEHGKFNLSSLIAALEIQYQKAEIDALAETIEEADLLREFATSVWSCSRYKSTGGWDACSSGYASLDALSNSHVVVPTIIYRKKM